MSYDDTDKAERKDRYHQRRRGHASPDPSEKPARKRREPYRRERVTFDEDDFDDWFDAE